jgi:hypothetical protein
MAKETREERRARIEQEVAERSAARREQYFEKQAASKAAAEANLAPLPEPDVYTYDYAWRQGVGTPEGEYRLTKTINPTYDPSTNTIVDPATGERRPVVMSKYGGPSSGGTGAGGTGGGGSGGSGGGGTGGGGSGGSGTGGGGSTTSSTTDAYTAFLTAEKAAADKLRRQSAFDILKAEFTKYGLGDLVDDFKKLIFADASPEEVVLKIRGTEAYQKRFAGNKMRLDAGLNVYDEATYIDLENAFEEAFTAYGVLESAGDTVEKRRAMYSTFIGGTISPNEVKGRIQLATVAANEDAITKATLKELYPMISDSDVVSYFLNPKETLPKLETKVRAAQIGAAAVRQGLVTNVNTAEELAAMGITEQRAEEVYSAYASMKPRLDLLSSLEQDASLAVDQTVAEDAFLRGLASEQRKIEQLRQKELSRFTGSSGAARNVSLSRGTGGQI